jgi:hypothetical protein
MSKLSSHSKSYLSIRAERVIFFRPVRRPAFGRPSWRARCRWRKECITERIVTTTVGALSRRHDRGESIGGNGSCGVCCSSGTVPDVRVATFARSVRAAANAPQIIAFVRITLARRLAEQGQSTFRNSTVRPIARLSEGGLEQILTVIPIIWLVGALDAAKNSVPRSTTLTFLYSSSLRFCLPLGSRRSFHSAACRGRSPRGASIRSDPNRLDDPQYILRLVGQVVRLSIETVTIIECLAPCA